MLDCIKRDVTFFKFLMMIILFVPFFPPEDTHQHHV